MKFLSIKEYFYKLNTIGFILLLLPLGSFGFLYFQLIYYVPLMEDKVSTTVVIIIALVIALPALTIVHWVWASKIKRLRKLLELVRKMEGYYSLMLMKMRAYTMCSMVMAIGLFLTGSSVFTGMFVFLTLALLFQWPSASSFSKHFKLNSNERDMMINNRDLYQSNRQA